MKTLSRQTKCARACVEQGGVEVEVHFFGEGWRGRWDRRIYRRVGQWKIATDFPTGDSRWWRASAVPIYRFSSAPDSLSVAIAASFRGTTLWPASRKKKKKEDISNERAGGNGDREENKYYRINQWTLSRVRLKVAGCTYARACNVPRDHASLRGCIYVHVSNGRPFLIVIYPWTVEGKGREIIGRGVKNITDDD